MRIKDNFKVRKIAGENLIVNQGATHSDLTKIISLNETAVYLWNELFGKDFTIDDAANLLVEKFGIDKEIALKDAGKWIDTMVSEEVIE
ncbi:MAG: PqqD family protein [Muribaculaceae bacterium]|nr:PqqD family protein [Muribaculaceae bacterium]